MPFSIRPLTKADVPAVERIEARVQDGWSRQGILSALDSPAARCFAACRDGVPAAFAAFTLVLDEANLDALSVGEPFRRQGAARALLEQAFESLRGQGARTVFLEVRAANTPALSLYRALNFIQIGIRKGFYTEPSDDAVLMKKDL